MEMGLKMSQDSVQAEKKLQFNITLLCVMSWLHGAEVRRWLYEMGVRVWLLSGCLVLLKLLRRNCQVYR